jgi:hypothetical protein
LALSDNESASGSSLRWRSEADLKAEGVRRNNHQPNSMTEENLLSNAGRKISPPLAAILSDASRIR